MDITIAAEIVRFEILLSPLYTRLFLWTGTAESAECSHVELNN